MINCSPIFSIIIPVYNRGNIILKTLQSTFNQTFKCYEVIVVDDGSTDQTLAILNEIRHPKLKIYHTTNQERGAARNFGSRYAAGIYLIFFDSDDLMYPNYLHDVYESLVSNCFPKIAYSGFEFVDCNNNILKKVIVSSKNFKRKLVYDNFLGCGSVLIKKVVFDQFLFNEDRRLSTSEDKELWLRVAADYDFFFIPIIGFAVVEHPGRSLNNLCLSSMIESRRVLLKNLKHNSSFKIGFSSLYNFFFAYELSLLVSLYSKRGQRKLARICFFKSFSLSPKIFLYKRFHAGMKNLLLRAYLKNTLTA